MAYLSLLIKVIDVEFPLFFYTNSLKSKMNVTVALFFSIIKVGAAN